MYAPTALAINLSPLSNLADRAKFIANAVGADALYVGNMLSGEISGQAHLGALIADFSGLRGIEAFKVEAACASAAVAFRR